MKLPFDTFGNEKQKECATAWGLNKEVSEIIYGGSKGSAKSYTGCSLIFGDALTYDGTFYFIARKKLNDLRKYTIPSIYEVFEHWGLDHTEYMTFNGQDSVFELNNGSKVFLIDAAYQPSDKLYARFGSMQMTRGWIEEGGEFESDAKTNLSASVGRWENKKYDLAPKVLITCNPSKNFLYDDYKANKEGKLPTHKKFIQALPDDNKKLPDGYLENLHRILDKNAKERLLYGNWEYDDDPLTMMDYDKILELFTNTFIQPTPDKYLIADIAYEGSDLFVIGYWEGLVLQHIEAIEKCDELHIGKTINDLRVKYSVPLGNVLYDADGLKKFVVQSAKTGLLNGAKQFHNGGKALNGENYYNLKSQCYFKAAELINNNKIFINFRDYRDQIIKECEQIKQLPLPDDGKLRVEKKADLKLRLGHSPDFFDMLAMRCFFEIKPVHQTTFISFK
jgi:hypothetical protein